MAVKDHANRRKSIAVTSRNSRSSIGPRHRRRAHSGAPSELSPLARSRLSGPFKGILKSSLKPPRTEDAPSGSQSPSRDSAVSQASSNMAEVDGDATQSMELTQDLRAKIHDDFARKSMGRRVSFNENAFLRFFTRPDNTNSTGSPQSSPGPPSSDAAQAPAVNDENAYSRAALARRRSSGRQSFGSDMELTSIGSTSAVMDESLSDMSDDMEITRAANQNISQRRVSIAAGHSYEISDESISFSEDLSHVEDDDTGPMDFTVPLAQPLRPASEDPVWLELQRITHAGTSLAFDDEMDDEQLQTSAYDDDQAVKDGRESLGFGLTGEESFSSMEESFTGPSDQSDKTLNLSKVFGRPSLGGGQGRPSDAESLMDESETYGHVLTAPASTTPSSAAPSSAAPSSAAPSSSVTISSTTSSSATPSIYPSALLAQEPPPPVFHPPPAHRSDNVSRETAPSVPSVFSRPKSVFTPKQPPAPPSKSHSPTKVVRSPMKPPHKPAPKQFSAAFAPPVARPSPKKPSSTGAVLKRPHPQDENVSDGPSPPKRANVGKDPQQNVANSAQNEAPTITASSPRPLSPSKRAPFEASTNTSTNARPSGIRRPSGYFARRRSTANGLTDTQEDATPSAPLSPKKKAPLGLGRASMGSGITDARKRFNTDSNSVATKPLVAELTVGNTSTTIPSPQQAEQPFISETPGPAADHAFVQDDVATFGVSDGIASAEVDRVAGVEATEAWRQNVDQEDVDEEDMPVISIEQFFALTGIKFMDDLQAPRRSMHPSHLRQARNPTEISLADYAITLAIDIPQLALYSRVSSDLQAWMQQSRIIFAEAEEEAGKMTPELFVEYSRADEEGQAELLHQLNLIRTNTRGLAKSDWYDWKLQWIDGLRVTAEQGLKELQADAKALETLCSQGNDVIPSLQAEYDAVMQELEREQAEVAEIEKCDQGFLNDLKTSIADQQTVLETWKEEMKEENDQLAWLEERLHEIELQKSQARSAIAEANRILHMQSSSTEVEVFRLRDELEALEDIHMFRITKVSAQEFEYEYASQFRVRVPCVNFRPVSSKIQITATESLRSRHKDTFPTLSRFFLTCATSFIREDSDRSIREIVHALRDYWSSCSQLRLQFKHIAIGFPVEVVTDTNTSSFALVVTIMFPERKAKAIVSFRFDSATFSRWPCSIRSLRHDVEVAYGDLDRNYLSDVITQSLSAKSSAENYACLAEACVDAQRAQ